MIAARTGGPVRGRSGARLAVGGFSFGSFGSPETVAGQVGELRRQGIESIFDRVQRSMELFATEVAPRFQDADAPLNPVRVRIEAGAARG